ncbi:MAG: hypothetical protein FWH27_16435 [Planctomycetaceae bacterium]|nr:hypothetical protein [Planctomycetaceae bacterium]
MQEKFNTPWYVVRDVRKGFKVVRDFDTVPGCCASKKRWKRWIRKSAVTKWQATEEEARLIVAALPMLEALKAVKQFFEDNPNVSGDADIKRQVDEALITAERKMFRD